MRLTRFGTIALADKNAEDSLDIQATPALVPLDEGSFDAQLGGRSENARKISRSFEIWPSETQTAQQAFNDLVLEIGQGLRILRGETRDGDRRQTWARADLMQHSWKSGELGYIPISMTFTLPDPYWYASDDELPVWDDGLVFDGSVTFGDGRHEEWDLTATSEDFTIDTLNSTGKIKRGWLHVVPQAGASITGLTIQNRLNMYTLHYSGTIKDGDLFDLILAPKTAWLNGASAWADIVIGGEQVAWMVLLPGLNPIRITAASITGTVRLYWYWSRTYVA